MANKSYHEIRQTCRLIDYSLKAAAKYWLWVETYEDSTGQYFALFSPDSTSQLPITITHYATSDHS